MSALGILLLAGAGALAGLLGGLFGIGGGVVVVPALYAAFGAMGVNDEVRMKLAVGTSLATILVTSARSLRAHHQARRVDWPVLRCWTPFIGLGALAGAALARVVSAEALTLLFAVGILSIAVQKVALGARRSREGRLPPRPVQAALGLSTGALSSLMGIGGGVFGVLLLTMFGRSVHVAVATAAGFGLAIAVPGALGFMAAGSGVPVPPHAIGFVHVPAFLVVAAASALTAPYGARLAHRLPARLLNRAFAGYLLLTGVLLLREAF